MGVAKEEVCVPGFLANGIHAGIKPEGRPDLALIYSELPAAAAGVFTTNSFKAAPVLLDMERIRAGRVQAVVVNSGVANAATGQEGYDDALAVSRAAARALRISDDLVQVASTGVIGPRIPLEKIIGAMDRLVAGLNARGIYAAEEAIMTTDRFPKIALRKVMIGTKEVTICGIAKGAGMIAPHMATMLAFVMTDAAIEDEHLHRLFARAVDRSFNAISVDGCMSTNDTALIMANGVAKNKTIRRGSAYSTRFCEGLSSLTEELAKAMVRDGEGATKIMEIVVQEAGTINQARRVANAIANSNLVKTAVYGGDPNWGRIISAAGSLGIDLPVGEVRLLINDIPVFLDGKGVPARQEDLAEVMTGQEIKVVLKLGMGRSSWKVWASDLGFEYIKINAHYHT